MSPKFELSSRHAGVGPLEPKVRRHLPRFAHPKAATSLQIDFRDARCMTPTFERGA